MHYFACKMFVEMSPDERRKALFQRKLCAQCFEPGIRFDEKHNCSKIYSCQDNFHRKFKNGLHGLVCERHRDKMDNQKLLEKFNKEVMEKYSNLENFSKNIGISYYRELGWYTRDTVQSRMLLMLM